MQKGKFNVLVVDNDSSYASRMICILNNYENISQVYYAANYSEAIRKLLLEKISLIFIETNLPGINGIQLLRTIHDSGYEATGVMMLNTPYEYFEDTCRPIGASYFFHKSDDHQNLPIALDQILIGYSKYKTQNSLSLCDHFQ